MTTSPQPTNIQNSPEMGFGEYLDRRMRDIMSRMNCITLGTIVSFNTTKQTAVISVNLKRVLRGTQQIEGIGLATDETISYATLQDVPVIFLNGGGAFLTFPVAVGDSCILMIADRDIDGWMATGAVNTPNTGRMHDLSDAIALIGIRDFKHSLASYDGTNLKLGFGGAYLTISPTGVISILKGSASINIDASNNITISGTNVTIIGSTQVAINP